MKGEEKSKAKEKQRKIDEDFGHHILGRIRKILWNLTEYPETSMAARFVGFLSLGLVIISTLTFIMSTFPGFITSAEN